MLRNLIESSSDELGPNGCRRFSTTFTRLIRNGDVDAVGALNQAQVDDEKLKAAFLDGHLDLRLAVFRLENHELLQGSLGAFELDHATLRTRAAVFQPLMSQPDLWSDLLAGS